MPTTSVVNGKYYKHIPTTSFLAVYEQ